MHFVFQLHFFFFLFLHLGNNFKLHFMISLLFSKILFVSDNEFFVITNVTEFLNTIAIKNKEYFL